MRSFPAGAGTGFQRNWDGVCVIAVDRMNPELGSLRNGGCPTLGNFRYSHLQIKGSYQRRQYYASVHLRFQVYRSWNGECRARDLFSKQAKRTFLRIILLFW